MIILLIDLIVCFVGLCVVYYELVQNYVGCYGFGNWDGVDVYVRVVMVFGDQFDVFVFLVDCVVWCQD